MCPEMKILWYEAYFTAISKRIPWKLSHKLLSNILIEKLKLKLIGNKHALIHVYFDVISDLEFQTDLNFK